MPPKKKVEVQEKPLLGRFKSNLKVWIGTDMYRRGGDWCILNDCRDGSGRRSASLRRWIGRFEYNFGI